MHPLQGLMGLRALGSSALVPNEVLGVTGAGVALILSLVAFLFERRHLASRLGARLVLRLCSVLLLVLGASLLGHYLLARALHISPVLASALGAALVAFAVLAAARSPATARRALRPSFEKDDSRWLVRLVELNDMTELQHFVVERLAARVRARHGTILLADAAGAAYRLGYSTLQRSALAAQGGLPAEAPIVALAAQRRRPILRAALQQADRRSASRILRDLAKLEAELVVPLIARGSLLGLVAFGRCLGADGYSEEAVERVRGDCDVIAAVLDNARVLNHALQDKLRGDVLLEQLTFGVLAADHTGAIVVCNLAARRILALQQSPEGQAAKVLGPALAPLLAPGPGGPTQAAHRETVLEVRGRGEVPVRVTAASVGGPLDRPGRVLLIEDLSERRELESELRRANRLASAGTLAAAMAHEIRNPLVSIKTYSQLLPERLDDREFQLRFANVAEREADAIAQGIERLLNFAGRIELERRPTDPGEEIRKVLDLVQAELLAKGISVETELAAGAPPVMADPEQFKQVVLNVVMNAVQAMEPGGRLRIAATAPDQGDRLGPDAYHVVIEDTGCGIPAEQLVKVFDPFFTTKERGFGLGLAMAQHLMEEHGGSIEITSEPGRGTLVTLTLPFVYAVGGVEKSKSKA